MGFIPQDLQQQLKGVRPIWIHAVSVGEVMASIPIIKKIKSEYPQKKLVLSTITATGNQTARQKIPEVDFFIYFPYDFLFVVKRVINIINPCIFIHTETEIWPNFLYVLERNGIPSIIVNGRISAESCRRYKFLGWFFKKVFDKVSVFGMQSLVDSQRVIKIGVAPRKVLITGNMKFDQQIPEINEERRRELLGCFNWSAENKIFIAGSTHAPEEEIILEVFQRLTKKYPFLALIIAPRHPERFLEVEKLIKKKGLTFFRRSQAKQNPPSYMPQVILLDTIGELIQIYSLGDIIFVGGSLVNIGGHNLLEPLVYKKPVLFGPYIHNVLELVEILQRSGAGILVNNKEELYFQIQNLLDNKEEIHYRGDCGYQIIKANQGATEKNMNIIRQFLR
ncbi:MAG: 3-deoxy-D-manno-octulosonic acid transferase [Desulfobacterota bacterium]|nr:3-deoxy-D-manno-octulosonic acid transferase [Thermodesulfobacteriota bacterium]